MVLHNVTLYNMVKILIDLTDEEDRLVEIYKLMNCFKTKQEAVKSMIQHFQVEIKPVNLRANDYFK